MSRFNTLDSSITILNGSSPPGDTVETDTAKIGSIYYDTSGGTWKKISNGNGIAKWELDTAIQAIKLTNITSSTVVDSLTTDDVAVWSIKATSTDNRANSETMILAAEHNDELAKYNFCSNMKSGTGIPGLEVNVLLVNGTLELVIEAILSVDVDVNRLSSVTSGSTSVIGLSSISKRILETETANRQSGFTALQNFINTNKYVLPVSDTNVLGGVKQGFGVNIDNEGVLSVDTTGMVRMSPTVTGNVDINGDILITGTVDPYSINTDWSLTLESTVDLKGESLLYSNGIPQGEPNHSKFYTTVTDNGTFIIKDVSGYNDISGAPPPDNVGVIRFSIDTNGVISPSITGATGPQGVPGINGTNGINGIDGAKGDPGPSGTNGAKGSPGINGTNGTNGVSLVFKGTVADQASLPATGNVQNDTYIIAGNAWVWNGIEWFDGGVIGSVGSGGSGLQVLTDADYFSTGVGTSDYKYVSIGDGSGTDGADYVDIYAFVDFINSVSIRSSNCIFGYFKNPGLVELDRDLYITNGEGNYFIQGAGVDGTVANGPWSDPVTLNITSINSEVYTEDNYPTHSGLGGYYHIELGVSSTDGLFVGGMLSIYPEVGTSTLPSNYTLCGCYRIYSIGTTTVTVISKLKSDESYNETHLPLITNITGVTAKFNRTVITSLFKNINIEGSIGNVNIDGGFLNVSFDSTKLFLSSNSTVIFYDNIHFGHDSGISTYCGVGTTITNWGDLFLGDYDTAVILFGGTLISSKDIYLGYGSLILATDNAYLKLKNLHYSNNHTDSFFPTVQGVPSGLILLNNSKINLISPKFDTSSIRQFTDGSAVYVS